MNISIPKTDKMRAQAAAAEEMLKALANRHRLVILCQLISGEQSVGDLTDYLGLRQTNVSQHLALLRKDGLVTTRRDGQTIWYQLANTDVKKLVGVLYDIYCGPRTACEPKPKGRNTHVAARSRTR